MAEPLLAVRDLAVSIFDAEGGRRVIENLTFDVFPGEVLAIIGESGSGKSLTTQAITGLLPSPPALVTGGAARFEGRDLIGLSERELRRLRGDRIGMIFQEPMSALDPMRSVGEQVAEMLVTHRGLSRRAARAETLAMFRRVRISDSERRMRQRPSALSGGMRQRVVIAAALICRPSLVIADEPTTALDATVAAEVLDLIAELRREAGCAVIFITHDIAVVRRVADRVLVLRRGQAVETGRVAEVLNAPSHPYTQQLVEAATTVPRRASEAVAGGPPAVLVENLRVSFPAAGGFLRPARFTAVDRVSLSIAAGETLALVGESGSGKSTTARAIAGLVTPDAGRVVIGCGGKAQFVFQDPQASLDPTFPTWRAITEPLYLDGTHDPAALRAAALPLLARVGLDPAHADRFPHELSGGQRQRLGIARALSVSPDLLIADEAVAALDAETRTTILDLLVAIQRETALPILFITHDLASVAAIAHEVAVMKSGRIIEQGRAAALLSAPRHPYTRALIDASTTEVA